VGSDNVSIWRDSYGNSLNLSFIGLEVVMKLNAVCFTVMIKEAVSELNHHLNNVLLYFNVG